MTNSTFADFVLKNEVIGFFDTPITLKSGRQSHFYVNWRRASNDAFLLDTLTDYLVAFIEQEGLNCETLYGVPEGATKTAVIAAFKLAKRSKNYAQGSHIIAMGRAKPKPHGDPADRFFIGAPKAGTYVLEDTITTGLSLFQCLDQLIEAGIEVRGVISLTDRCEVRDDGLTAAEYLQKHYNGKISYHPLSLAPDLLAKAIKAQKPDVRIVKALVEELRLNPTEFGV
jgi:orotate phosphoribosyltransferase